MLCSLIQKSTDIYLVHNSSRDIDLQFGTKYISACPSDRLYGPIIIDCALKYNPKMRGSGRSFVFNFFSHLPIDIYLVQNSRRYIDLQFGTKYVRVCPSVRLTRPIVRDLYLKKSPR